MRKLGESDRSRLLEYLCAEPECNIFIIGDVENFGFDDENVEVFAHEREGGEFDSIALRFFANYVIYAAAPDFNAKALADFLQSRKLDMISGKGDVCRALMPYFEGRALRETRLAGCREPREFPFDSDELVMRRMRADEAEGIVELFGEIDEFKDNYIEGEMRARRVEEKRAEIERGSEVCFGVFSGAQLVSTAAVAACCSAGGMVVGVATRKGWRGRGLASAVVSAVCRERISSGCRTLAIFYDNPEAAKIYEKIGFVEVGDYGMIKGG